MKILVGYNGGEVGRMSLCLARDFAVKNQALVYVVTSMEGGASEKPEDIVQAESYLAFARQLMERSNVQCDALQSVRGLSPGEDLVKFAKENQIDHIFLGIKKKSRAQKAILGSTARYVILKAPCPVTTVKFELADMTAADLLKDRQILVVDDEPDILETIKELLDTCFIDTAATFEDAQKYLENRFYDAAILDIMGVRGYDILTLAQDKGVVSLMLTAHALTPENLKESIQKGANAYIPKDELFNIDAHLANAIKSHLAGKKEDSAWFFTLKPVFDKVFGSGWKEKDKPFWNSMDDRYGR